MGVVDKEKEKDVDDQEVDEDGSTNYKKDSQYGSHMMRKVIKPILRTIAQKKILLTTDRS